MMKMVTAHMCQMCTPKQLSGTGVGSEKLHQERAPLHPSPAAQQPAANCALLGP